MKKSIFIFFLLVLTTLSLTACGKGNGSGDNNGGNDTHVHTFSNEWSNDQTYHWKESTCGHNNTERKEFHDFENNVCKVCAYEKEIPHEHTFATEWSSDETYHWYASTCNHPETEQKIAHEFVDGVCVCGYEQIKEPVIPDEPDTPEVPDEPNVPSEPEIPDEPDVPSEPEHEHTFASEWSSDETYHWHASTCGHNDTIEYIEHDNKDGVCSQCGFDTHKHTFANEWSKDETYHWYASTCGHNDTIEYIEHDFENRVCVDCGQEYFSQGLEYELNEDDESYSVVGIGDCEDLELYIPETYENLPVTSIGDYAFENCLSLRDVKLPNSITRIGTLAFGYCSSLLEIIIPCSVTSIGGWTFYKCSSLKRVVIDDCAIAIEERMFEDCISLESISLGKNITSIKLLAFYNCTSLGELKIPASVAEINECSFPNCTSLTKIEVDENNENYKTISDNLYTKDGKTLIQFVLGKNPLGYIAPKGLEVLGNYAFYAASSLVSIDLGDDVKNIGTSTFYNCSSLKMIFVGEGNEKFKSIDGNLYSKDERVLIQYAIGKNETKFIIPTNTTRVDDEAFRGASKITEVIVCKNVTEIGAYSFYGCENLTIYCEAESKPDGWSENWNPDNRPVVWGYNSQPEEPEHTHTFASEWSSDDTYHWYASTCGHDDTIEYIEHEFVDYICVDCGFEAERPHEHTFANEWSKDETYHWYASTCNHPETEIKTAHTYDCGRCLVCGYLDYSEGLDIRDNVLYGRGTCSDKYVVVPDYVTSVVDGAFSGDNEIYSIIFPNLSYVGEYSFNGCVNLHTVDFVDGTSGTHIDEGAFFCSNLVRFTIPTNARFNGTLGNEFDNCYRLTEVYAPGGDELPYTGPAYCHPLRVYSGERDSWITDDGNGLITFDDGTDVYLVGYYGGDTVDIPEGVTKINQCADIYATNVTLPTTLKYIGDLGFTTGIIENLYIKDLKAWCSVEVDFWQVCGDGPFSMHGINVYVDGELVTQITIPEGVAEIKSGTFCNWNNLEKVIVPIEVTSIGNLALSSKTNITVCCEAQSQPDGWIDDWDCYNCTVVWGYSGEDGHVYSTEWTVDVEPTKHTAGEKSKHCIAHEDCEARTEITVLPAWSGDSAWTPNA